MSRSASQSSSSCSQPAACSSYHTLDGSDGDWPAEQVSKAWPATTKMRVDARARDARLQSGKLRRAPRAGAEDVT